MRVTRNSRSRAKMSASCSASSFADTLRTSSWACATVTALSGRLGTTLKFALVAPIPSNRVRVSTTVNPGDRRSSRTAWRRSWARLRIWLDGERTVRVGGAPAYITGSSPPRGPGRPFGIQGRRVSSWRGNYLVRCDLDCHRRGKEQQQRTLLNLPPQQRWP